MPLQRVNTTNPWEQANMFEGIMHHDNHEQKFFLVMERNGSIGQLRLRNMKSLGKYKKRDLETNYNCYMTINTFAGKKRTADSLYNRCALYVDIDAHDIKNPVDLYHAKEEMMDILIDCFENGNLAAPTMITDTGRGFGLYYVLDKSIANVDAAKNSLRYCQWIQELLLAKYSDILKENDAPMTIDFAVSDSTRIVRVPGTTNRKTGTSCRLMFVNMENGRPKYFSLNEIKNTCGLEEYMIMDSKAWAHNMHPHRMKTENQMKFMHFRLVSLLKLVKLKRNDCEGVREKLLFAIFNTQLALGDDEAETYIYEYNQWFYNPLPDSEVDHIVREGRKKIYKFRNSFLIDFLEMSDYEAAECGFHKSEKKIATRKAELAAQREIRNENILRMAEDSTCYTYEQIAEHFHLSIRTIKDVLKKLGYHRYYKGDVKPEAAVVTDEPEKSEENKTIAVFSLRDNIFARPGEKMKRQNSSKARHESAVNNSISHGVEKATSWCTRTQLVPQELYGIHILPLPPRLQMLREFCV